MKTTEMYSFFKISIRRKYFERFAVSCLNCRGNMGSSCPVYVTLIAGNYETVPLRFSGQLSRTTSRH